MLWQKQIINGTDMYVNLMKKNEMSLCAKEFAKKLKTFEEQNILVGKNNLFSKEIRAEGNVSFMQGHFELSISTYNRTITLAEINSEELGICYANRSACFFELKEYSLCLADIELAKENEYPMRLMEKLDRRKKECLKFIENQTDETRSWHEIPKLSFEPHLQFPCFASDIEVNFLKETQENMITTNVDLEIGQTVIIERAMAFTPAGGKDMGYCHYCFKKNVNLIPCETCIIALFCSQRCYNAANKYHVIVCNLEHFIDSCVPYQLLRSLIFGINAFSTIENLMTAVESYHQQSDKGINPYSDPAKRQYFQFFGLHSIVHQMNKAEKAQIKKFVIEVAMFIKDVSKLKAMFQSQKLFQFLLHLSLHHMEIICSNGYNAFHYYAGSPLEMTLGIKDGKLQKHENVAINFLRYNDHIHPTEETLKMQYVLIQIWNLIMRL